MARPQSTSGTSRYAAIDALRGIAIVLMIAYHFMFDLNYFGLLQLDMNHDPFWLGARTLIVSLFLGLVGVSLYLATARGLNRARYARRLALLVLYAALVSAGSYLVFPDSMIFFGVLHFIALASVLGLAFTGLYWANLVLGVGLVILGLAVQHPAFDQPALQWLGLMTHKPVTEDYVPLLPWFGVVLIGLFLGRAVFGQRPLPRLATWRSAHPLFRTLAWGGRHGLHIYMLHQPLLFGLLFVGLSVFGRL